MIAYEQEIIAASGCDPRHVAAVAQVMRDNNGGLLDALSRARFNREARKAAGYIAALLQLAPDPAPHLRELGLTREEFENLLQYYRLDTTATAPR